MHETVTVTIVNDDGTDATLSGLVLNDGTNDLALTPTFATDTTSYAASVGNAVSQITVTPETTDTDATVAYFDASDTAIVDADGAATGHQVGLDVGANVIKVTVTAEDTMTTETYTVVVTRAAVSATTPTVTGIAVTGSPREGATAYGSEDGVGNRGVQFTVTFSEAVVVNWDANSGTYGATFTVNVGGTNRTAFIGDNDSSTPMTAQFFGAAMETGDEDTDGISIDAGSIALLNSGTIQNGSGEDATLTHGAFSFPDEKVDGVFPTFDSAKILHGDGRHRAGADLQRDAERQPSGRRPRAKGERLLGERRRHGQHGDGVRDRRQHGDADADRRGRGGRHRRDGELHQTG